MSNSKPCNMHYNNTGILQTFFNPACAEHTTDTTPAQFYSLPLCYYFPSIRAPSICLSICPSLSMLLHLMSMYPSITLSLHFTPFHCCTALFSSLDIVCLLTPPSCLSVCLCRDHIFCLIFNVMMIQLQMQAFLQQNWHLGSFNSYFCFRCRLA